MKKLFISLQVFALLFSACSDESNWDNDRETIPNTPHVEVASFFKDKTFKNEKNNLLIALLNMPEDCSIKLSGSDVTFDRESFNSQSSTVVQYTPNADNAKITCLIRDRKGVLLDTTITLQAIERVDKSINYIKAQTIITEQGGFSFISKPFPHKYRVNALVFPAFPINEVLTFSRPTANVSSNNWGLQTLPLAAVYPDKRELTPQLQVSWLDSWIGNSETPVTFTSVEISDALIYKPSDSKITYNWITNQ